MCVCCGDGIGGGVSLNWNARLAEARLTQEAPGPELQQRHLWLFHSSYADSQLEVWRKTAIQDSEASLWRLRCWKTRLRRSGACLSSSAVRFRPLLGKFGGLPPQRASEGAHLHLIHAPEAFPRKLPCRSCSLPAPIPPPNPAAAPPGRPVMEPYVVNITSESPLPS